MHPLVEVIKDNKTITALIDEWVVIMYDDMRHVVGKVYGDKSGRYEDGTVIVTSQIWSMWWEIAEGKICCTENYHTYMLGSPHE